MVGYLVVMDMNLGQAPGDSEGQGGQALLWSMGWQVGLELATEATATFMPLEWLSIKLIH